MNSGAVTSRLLAVLVLLVAAPFAVAQETELVEFCGSYDLPPTDSLAVEVEVCEVSAGEIVAKGSVTYEGEDQGLPAVVVTRTAPQTSAENVIDGKTTDIDGRFALSEVRPGDVLRFQFVGALPSVVEVPDLRGDGACVRVRGRTEAPGAD